MPTTGRVAVPDWKLAKVSTLPVTLSLTWPPPSLPKVNPVYSTMAPVTVLTT